VHLNKHFDIPHAVSSMFTGREKLLEELGNALNVSASPEGHNSQKRFVVQGLGGSGKTEFCCKFAQDNRQK
jgi:signal recognition particle GTPase